MSQNKVKKVRDRRKEHNQDLIRRMRNGETLTSFDSRSSWYPPRPTIAKDPRETARLYRAEAEEAGAAAAVQDNALPGAVLGLGDAG